MTRLVLAAALAVLVPGLVLGGLAGCSSSPPGGGPALPDCTSLVAPSSCPSPAPSWKGEVQGLVAKYCVQCHGEGGIAQAQANLATYSDVFLNRDRLWLAVYNCSMPNVDASPPPNAFPTLAERETLVTWADVCGAPDD